MERITRLEMSQTAMKGKLTELFDRAKSIEEKLELREKDYERSKKKLEALIERIDNIVDRLIALEEISSTLKKLSHNHKIIK